MTAPDRPPSPDSPPLRRPTGDLPLPDAPPPAMPESARTGGPPPEPSEPPGPSGRAAKRGDSGNVRDDDDGERAAGGIPPGTGPDVPAPYGTSEDRPAEQGIHRPDVGPGGEDLDTVSPPLPGRSDNAR